MRAVTQKSTIAKHDTRSICLLFEREAHIPAAASQTNLFFFHCGQSGKSKLQMVIKVVGGFDENIKMHIPTY